MEEMYRARDGQRRGVALPCPLGTLLSWNLYMHTNLEALEPCPLRFLWSCIA